MPFITEQKANWRVSQLVDIEPERLVRDYQNGPNHRPTAGHRPLLELCYELTLGSFPIYCKGIDSVGTKPFDLSMLIIMFQEKEKCNQPSSLAQFLTRLEGQAITHFWIVDFPASGDCFSKVHMRVMHCSYTSLLQTPDLFLALATHGLSQPHLISHDAAT